ncbi:MAG: hypothetical protein CMJ78_12925 [Planctomycetaceae bacterium]|nr:hypothetical protein [Planctomycetaceae bacterium]
MANRDTRKDIDTDAYRSFALEPPVMTVLSDEPASTEAAIYECFNLSANLGPVYDILRHPNTETPLSVAIYGDWGTGKTTAMRWRETLLTEWNPHGVQSKDDQLLGKKVRPVWFYPWKYNDKQDVWRGLVAEVILASTNLGQPTKGRIESAVKRFGMFLGRSFVHAMDAVSVSALGVKLETKPSEIAKGISDLAHPEKAYLNQFENSLQSWVSETITKANERMVVFIDDLDRCMPEVAL